MEILLSLFTQVSTQARKGKQFAASPVRSAFSVPFMPGYVYVEAPSRDHASRAVSRNAIIDEDILGPISLEEVADLLSRNTDPILLEEGVWIRIRRGPFQGNLAYVHRVLDPVPNQPECVSVKVIRPPTLLHIYPQRSRESSRHSNSLLDLDIRPNSLNIDTRIARILPDRYQTELWDWCQDEHIRALFRQLSDKCSHTLCPRAARLSGDGHSTNISVMPNSSPGMRGKGVSPTKRLTTKQSLENSDILFINEKNPGEYCLVRSLCGKHKGKCGWIPIPGERTSGHDSGVQVSLSLSLLF